LAQIILDLKAALELGEGQFIEFKESPDKSLPREMVAFANASGGVIYLGITDSGQIKGIETSNRLKSQIQDTARNCDPPVAVLLTQIQNVLAIEVKEGVNKPYSCSSGFYMRMGANSQKMNRDEIPALVIKTGKIRYDEQICTDFDWKDFDDEKRVDILDKKEVDRGIIGNWVTPLPSKSLKTVSLSTTKENYYSPKVISESAVKPETDCS